MGTGGGSWVRVVDLGGLSSAADNVIHDDVPLRTIHAFRAGAGAVGGLAFSADGTRVFAVRRDGVGAGVWGLRPGAAQAEQMYDLRRGRTGAVVEALAGAQDGRFVALATRRRTVHVFAVNPYGGRADVRSHLGARVRDAAEGLGGSGGVGVEQVYPLVRMRLPQRQQQQQQAEEVMPPAPLAIVFVPPAADAGAPSSPAAAPVGVQDVLVFDPADGVLSLRRVTLALEPASHAAGLPISVSLPAGRLGVSMSVSPPTYGSPASSYAAGGGAGEPAAGMELGAREAVVATWSLRRRRGWAEIRRAVLGDGGVVEKAGGGKQDWLAQAELSTFSRAPRVLPRTIYLSHQFAFHTLGEDYHALIRRYKLDIGGAKIEVRKEVEVSYSAGGGGGGGESFVEGYASSPRAIRRRSRTSSTFDEPLASALAGAHYALPPPVLPMLPNGSPSSFRSSIPIRTMAGL
ncbi:hypothetical protein C8J57DRAFT_1136067, partial [Mycena rebaudengoi]